MPLIRLTMHTTRLLMAVCCLWISTVNAQEVVLAFEKTLAPATSLDGMARTKMLISNMAKANVTQAIFLINGKDITAKTLPRVDYYDQMGQFLVSTGFNYSIYHRVKNYSLQIDIMKANGLLASYSNYHQFLSYPPLDDQNNPLQDSLRQYLTEHDYQPIYITTYVNDDLMDALYQKRIVAGKSVDIHKLEKAYVNMAVDAAEAYAGNARLMLGFSARQVLLLHENDLTAYCIMGLIDALAAKGFTVISPDKVFSDPIANPFFVSGFNRLSNMNEALGVHINARPFPYVANESERNKVHQYLTAQGLDVLVSGN
jgi:peptidoglycan-N-acetylglucosamine deacetylase